MAWIQTSGGAVEIFEVDGSKQFVHGTSTGTMNLSEMSSWDVSLPELRMFGLTEDGIIAAGSSNLPFVFNAPPPELSGDTGDEERLCYLDSVACDSATLGDCVPVSFGTGDPRLLIRVNQPASEEDMKKTVIPVSSSAQNWYYTQVWYGEDDPPETSSTTGIEEFHPVGGGLEQDAQPVYNLRDLVDPLEVRYGGPSIVHLPSGGGWLMLLSRLRWRAGDPGAPSGTVSSGPENTMSDIVAYWAHEDHPDFADASFVKGPIWIACNIGTLGPDTEGVRFWLSVPTGAVLSETQIAVYFVVNITSYLADGDEDTRQEVWKTLKNFDRAYDASDPNAYFQTCIGVHLITIDDLTTMFDKGRVDATTGEYVEAVWATTTSGTTYKVPADKLVLYTWLDETTELVSYHALAIGDPQCARCSLEAQDITSSDSIRLFHSVTSHQDTEYTSSVWNSDFNAPMVGLWVAKPSTARTVTRRDGTTADTIVGVDFDYISPAPFLAATRNSSDTLTSVPIDPDPVLMTDGTWRVAFGQLGQDGGVFNTPLSEVRGESADVCADSAASSARVVSRIGLHRVRHSGKIKLKDAIRHFG